MKPKTLTQKTSRTLELLALLMVTPSTPGDVAERWGYPKARDRVTLHFDRLLEVGLIYVSAWRSYDQPVYSAQVVPFEKADAPQPAPRSRGIGPRLTTTAWG